MRWGGEEIVKSCEKRNVSRRVNVLARTRPGSDCGVLVRTTRPTRCILMVMVVMHLYSTTDSYVCIDGDGSIEVIVIDLTL
jgi:hypothetical protein